MIFMIVVIFILLIILSQLISIFYSIIISFIILLVWMRFNYRQGQYGIAIANVKAYFSLRKRGASHKDALIGMVVSRYQFEQNKVSELFYRFQKEFSDINKNYDMQIQNQEELEGIILLIYSNDVPEVFKSEKSVKKTISIIKGEVEKAKVMNDFQGIGIP